MKKKFMLIVSLLLAFVMSFALIACGSDGNGSGAADANGSETGGESGAEEKDPTMAEVYASLDKILNGDGVKGAATVKYSSAGAAEKTVGMQLDVRGKQLKATVKDVEYLVDLETGNTYKKPEGKWLYGEQVFPQGLVEYTVSVIAASGKKAEAKTSDTAAETEESISAKDILASIADKFAYDKTTRSFTADIDLKAEVNDILDVVYEAYGDDASVGALIDSFLQLALIEAKKNIAEQSPVIGQFIVGLPNNITLETLLKKTADAITQKGLAGESLGDMTLEDMFDLIEGMGYSDIVSTIKDAMSGVVTADNAKAVYGRKLSQMLEGAIKFVDDNIDLTAKDGVQKFIAAVKEDKDTVEQELLTDVLFASVDTSKLADDLKKYNDLIVGILNSTKLKDIVNGVKPDGAGAVVMEVVKTCLGDAVKLDKLGGKVTFGLVGSDVKKISVSAEVKHGYNKTTKLPVLSDNDYKASFDLDISEVYTTATPFDITVEGGYVCREVEAIVCADSLGDVRIRYESAPIGDSAIAEAAAYYLKTDGTTAIVASPKVTYDKANGAVVFKKEILQTAAADKAFSGLVGAKMSFGSGENDNFTASVIVVPDRSVKSLFGIVKGLIPMPEAA